MRRKQSLAYRFFIRYSIKVLYVQFMRHSSNALTFAVN